MPPTLDDYRWLLSADAHVWLEEVAQQGNLAGAELVRQVQRLRKHLSAERAHLVVEQTDLRRRAREKFSQAERLFFTRVGLEQATDEGIAAYKAGRFGDGPVVDLCCGIGGDLMALAGRGPVTGVDLSPVSALLARQNCAAVGHREMHVVQERAESFDLSSSAAWHIDPDRRPAGKRTTRVELHEPPLAALEQMLAANRQGAIKLAPAAELPETWKDAAEYEWIGSRGECRQLVAWHGELARRPGKRVATVIGSGGESSSLHGRGDEGVPVAASVQRYVYEPHAAVLAARLTGALCAEHQLAAITFGIAYLTADQLVESEFLDRFEVLEVLPFDLKRLRAWHAERGIGRVEVKKRGVDVEPARLQRELQGKGDGQGVVLLMPIAGRTTAILARRA